MPEGENMTQFPPEKRDEKRDTSSPEPTPDAASYGRRVSPGRKKSGPKLSDASIAMREAVDELLRTRQPIDAEAIAAQYNVSRNAVYKYAYAEGMTPTLRIDETTKQQLTDALPTLWTDLSISIIDIAERFGVSVSTINKIRKDLHLPKRERPQTRTQAPKKK